MSDELRIVTTITLRGIPLQINQILAQVDLEGMLPCNNPYIEPWDMLREQQRGERRQALVAHIASGIAHSLTEELFALAQGKHR